jgi:hypothetical protein
MQRGAQMEHGDVDLHANYLCVNSLGAAAERFISHALRH